MTPEEQQAIARRMLAAMMGPQGPTMGRPAPPPEFVGPPAPPPPEFVGPPGPPLSPLPTGTALDAMLRKGQYYDEVARSELEGRRIQERVNHMRDVNARLFTGQEMRPGSKDLSFGAAGTNKKVHSRSKKN